jgi:hypothetical protein
LGYNLVDFSQTHLVTLISLNDLDKCQATLKHLARMIFNYSGSKVSAADG